jgi:transcriptional regulator with XRE-family HTH domain
MTHQRAPDYEDVGRRVARARRESGLTQRDAARHLKVSLWTIDELEAGRRDPERHLRRIADLTDRPTSWFRDGSDVDRNRMRALATKHDHRQGLEMSSRARPALPARTLRMLAGGFGKSFSQARGGGSGGQLNADSPRPNGLSPARVRRARQEAGLTRKELAAQLGVSLWIVERLEAGEEVSTLSVAAIAETTGKPAEWLHESSQKAQPTEAVAKPGGAEHPATSSRSSHGLTLVLTAVTLLVVVRFFTEVVGILPRAFNFIDVPLVAALAITAATRHALPSERAEAARYLPACFLFLVLCVLAALANPSRVSLGPVLVFIYGFLAPLVVYWSVYRLWPVGRALSLSRLLVGLLLVQLMVVALIDLPRFLATDDPDQISGTFGTNPYQLVFFLLVGSAIVAGIFTFEQRRAVARFAPAFFVAVLGVIMLAQYRALLFTTALTILVVTMVLGSARARGLVAGAVIAVAFITALSYTSQAFPILNFAPVISTFRSDPTSYVSERAHALSHFARLYGDEPRYIATGTGPGTYSSRAWQTFSQIHSRSHSNVQGKYVSALTGGKAYSSDVSEKYVEPQFTTGEAIQGSKALASPFSSYGALFAEVGLLGFLVMMGIYLGALVQAVRMTRVARLRGRQGDPLPALVFGSASAFFVLLQMGFLENWLEVTRATFPAWILLAVATKEYRARSWQPG